MLALNRERAGHRDPATRLSTTLSSSVSTPGFAKARILRRICKGFVPRDKNTRDDARRRRVVQLHGGAWRAGGVASRAGRRWRVDNRGRCAAGGAAVVTFAGPGAVFEDSCMNHRCMMSV